jgi:hypothetical protein
MGIRLKKARIHIIEKPVIKNSSQNIEKIM